MKYVKTAVIISLLLLALTACGKETFSCGWCGDTVTETPNTLEIGGESTKICDRCYDELKAAGINS